MTLHALPSVGGFSHWVFGHTTCIFQLRVSLCFETGFEDR